MSSDAPDPGGDRDRPEGQPIALTGVPSGVRGFAPEVSVVIPAFNEAPNLPDVVAELYGVLERWGATFEVIVVNDGSTDATRSVLTQLRRDYPECRPVNLRRNSGKAAALAIGFRISRGRVVAMMDADGQDDPAEIPRMAALLGERCQLVSGLRVNRQDRVIKRRTSQLYNAVTARVTSVQGNDMNSGLKAMTAEFAKSVDLYGELHRYLPVLATWQGFAVEELEVNHRSRLHGSSKYGIARFWRGMFDLVTVKFLTSYNRRPFHLFGGAGILSGMIGSGLLAWMLAVHLSGRPVADRPALIAGVLFELVAVQLFCLGLLAELLVHLRQPREIRWEQETDREGRQPPS
ncbi:MAG: glycosyltransferase family 2 protein [Acidimicrobiales bacterium]|jgi:dolichol-phosphate mannosyltransferase